MEKILQRLPIWGAVLASLVLAYQVGRSTSLVGALAGLIFVAIVLGMVVTEYRQSQAHEAERQRHLAEPADQDARMIAEERGRMGPIPIRYL